jgi:hypothetical protein
MANNSIKDDLKVFLPVISKKDNLFIGFKK